VTAIELGCSAATATAFLDWAAHLLHIGVINRHHVIITTL
jgi:hypothetical protein